MVSLFKVKNRLYLRFESDSQAADFNTYLIGRLDPINKKNTILFVDENRDIFTPAPLLDVIVFYLGKRRIQYNLFEDSENNHHPDTPISIPPDFLSEITLRDYQIDAIEKSILSGFGIVESPTGSGKTEIMAGVVKWIYENSGGRILVLVPSVELADQTKKRFISRGIKRVGKLQGSTREYDADILVSTVQSAHRRLSSEEADGGFSKWVSEGLAALIADEAHHSTANTWVQIIDSIQSDYRFAFTATPFYRDTKNAVRDLLMFGAWGKVAYKIEAAELARLGVIALPKIYQIKSKCPGNDLWLIKSWKILESAGIISNHYRNDQISSVIRYFLNAGKSVLVTVNKIPHGEYLSSKISLTYDRPVYYKTGASLLIFIQGHKVEEIPGGWPKVKEDISLGVCKILIGTSVMDEGVDFPDLGALIMAGGGKSSIKAVQRLGRPLRKKSGDNTAVIVDFADNFSPVTLAHSKARRKAIEKAGFDSKVVESVDEFFNLIEGN